MGGMLGNKRQDRGKKNFRGPEIWGGERLGEMQKKGWKNFLAVPKSGGNFFGGHNNFLGGEFFRKNLKKKNPRRGFSAKLSQKNLGGIFRGVVYRGTCVGECWEIKDKIGENIFSGGQKFGGGTFGKFQRTKFRGKFLGGG